MTTQIVLSVGSFNYWKIVLLLYNSFDIIVFGAVYNRTQI